MRCPDCGSEYKDGIGVTIHAGQGDCEIPDDFELEKEECRQCSRPPAFEGLCVAHFRETHEPAQRHWWAD